MLSRKILFILICIALALPVSACSGMPANSSDNTSGYNSPGNPVYATEQVKEIARAFSPDCRKKIPPKEGAG